MKCVLPLPVMHCEESDGYSADLPVYPHPGSGYILQPSLAFLTVSFMKNHFNHITKAFANLLAYLFCNADNVTRSSHFEEFLRKILIPYYLPLIL